MWIFSAFFPSVESKLNIFGLIKIFAVAVFVPAPSAFLLTDLLASWTVWTGFSGVLSLKVQRFLWNGLQPLESCCSVTVCSRRLRSILDGLRMDGLCDVRVYFVPAFQRTLSRVTLTAPPQPWTGFRTTFGPSAALFPSSLSQSDTHQRHDLLTEV